MEKFKLYFEDENCNHYFIDDSDSSINGRVRCEKCNAIHTFWKKIDETERILKILNRNSSINSVKEFFD